MALQKVYSAKDFGRVLKATIQNTGRLGFSAETAKFMGIDSDSYFIIGNDDRVQADLILVKLANADPDAFRARKSSDYFYLATTALFDMLGYDYKSNENIYFDVIRFPSLDKEAEGEVYIMNKRESKGRKSKKNEQTPKYSERSLLDLIEEEEQNS